MSYGIDSHSLAFGGEGVGTYFQMLRDLCEEFDTDFLVVGAFARDLLLMHHLGGEPGVGTQDIDIGIWLPSWEVYHVFTDRLQTDHGFTPVGGQQVHAFVSSNKLQTDILPFGEIEQQRTITFPRATSFVLNMMGFQEATRDSLEFLLDDTVRFSTPSPAGMVMLKLIAWSDRRGQQTALKHAVDIALLLNSYFEGTIDSSSDDPVYLAAFGAVEPLEELWYHSAWVIGRQIGELCGGFPETGRTLTIVLDDILLPGNEASFLTPLSWHLQTDIAGCREGIKYMRSAMVELLPE